jgi:hypothetical protein
VVVGKLLGPNLENTLRKPITKKSGLHQLSFADDPGLAPRRGEGKHTIYLTQNLCQHGPSSIRISTTHLLSFTPRPAAFIPSDPFCHNSLKLSHDSACAVSRLSALRPILANKSVGLGVDAVYEDQGPETSVLDLHIERH